MRRRSASHDLGTFPSPGAPKYRGSNIGCQKGWASERVPLPLTAAGGRQVGMMFSSGRTLPSKWEDAERWICSPLSGYGISANTNSKSLNSQPQKRPKSKSGPIMQTGRSSSSASAAYYSSYHSPFSTGVLAAESLYGGGGGGLLSSLASSIPGWPEMRESNGCPSPKVWNLGEEKNEETSVSRAVSQRDMATQMSPKECCRCSISSTMGRSSFASSPPALLSITEQQSEHSAKLEVRDVQVDKRATMIRWTKKRGIRMIKKDQSGANGFGEKAMGVSSSSFDVSEAAMENSKRQREEAKITAWENLQKAKAEAAIRKLEMKLEKKRSETMDNIIDKLRKAQFKAHKMRNKLSSAHHHDIDNHDQHDQEVPRTPPKFFSFRKFRVGSLSRFFLACRAFYTSSATLFSPPAN